ncbi:MORN repeat protein [compost metagenome]
MYYEGEHQQGVYHGKGKFYMNGTIAYDGDFVDGNANGYGKMYDQGKLAYDGEVIDNMPTGNGKNYLGDNSVKISITIHNTAAKKPSSGTFNVPAGIRIPTRADIQ